MKSEKKAQGLSINTVIVAVIAILVLVLLIAIVGKNVRDLNRTTDTCEKTGGTCVVGGCNPEVGFVPHGRLTTCETPTGEPQQYCCVATK